MKKCLNSFGICPVLLTLLSLTFTTKTLKCQVTAAPVGDGWTPIGDVQITTINSDGDNGDGTGDGAFFIDGKSAAVGQGVSYVFDGTMVLNESISITTYLFNVNVSFVAFNVELYNSNDNTVLASDALVINGGDTAPKLVTLNYTALSSDAGDACKIRFIRTDDGNTARNFAIDNINLNGSFVPMTNAVCTYSETPDLSNITSSTTIDNEIELCVTRFSNDFLGTSAPSAAQLSAAETAYDNLNIVVTGSTIGGNTITSFSQLSFLKTFAQHLKFNPSDAAIEEKANNTIWLASTQVCDGSLAIDKNGYAYRGFAEPAILLESALSAEVKDLFAYTLFKHTNDRAYYWEPSYDAAFQASNGSINTDVIYNLSEVMMVYCSWLDTQDERYLYMRGFKRYMERFMSPTYGTSDGIKKDGSGYHHWTAYNDYMYAYRTATLVLYYMRGTRFQVGEEYYKHFRDGVYALFAQSNDNGVFAHATSGRNPHGRQRSFGEADLERLAIVGGEILGQTEDTLIAGLSNRIYGVNTNFTYDKLGDFDNGFFQMNHANAGAFRKEGNVIFSKGFSSNLWGSELYANDNRYGRYQSYGGMEILYPGNKEVGNGYNVETWNWNFNPGATVIHLPWDKLHGERARIDELQQKRFVGSLAFEQKDRDLLQETYGRVGMFAMDFQEKEGQGFSTVHSGENHNNTFTFKKSHFYFEDLILSLGSNISNDDNTNATVTTLFQRIDNKGVGSIINGNSQTSAGETNYAGSSDNWIISNYNTGFYLVSGNYELKLKKEAQQTPNENQVHPANISGNPTQTYYTGYIDHGLAPSNKSYEYVVIPNATTTQMDDLKTDIQAGNKPYTIHQQDGNAHIVEHRDSKAWGYAFFAPNTTLNYNYLKSVDGTCLIMSQESVTGDTIRISVVNPDLGYESRAYTASIGTSVNVKVEGDWRLEAGGADVSLNTSSSTEIDLQFSLIDGLPEEVLLINNCQSSQGADVQNVCDSYTWIDGNTYTVSNNTATHALMNAAGCDSIVTLNLTIDNLDKTVSATNNSLTANQAGAIYQWIDCLNGDSPISGETAQTFTPTVDGEYAVIVENGSCKDTSDCSVINTTSLFSHEQEEIKVFPNPTKNLLNVNTTAEVQQIIIYDMTGKEIKREATKSFSVSHLQPGVYYIDVNTTEGFYTTRFVKN